MARLVCIFAEGVDLGAVSDQTSMFPLGEDGLVVGREGSLEKAWDSLMPDTTHRSRISRKHFKVCLKSAEEGFCLTCLSVNGMLHNERFIQEGSEVLLQNGDNISLETV